MTETVLICLFSGCYALTCFAIITGSAFAFAFSSRMAIMETRWDLWMDSLGKSAARMVHRDDDMHGIDAMLDKYIANHFLSPEEWGAIKIVCDRVVLDKTLGEEFKVGYVLLGAVCDDKMAPYKAYWRGEPKIAL